MKEQLISFLAETRRKAGKIAAFDEVATKQALILRLFQLLGWSTFDTDEVRPEYVLEGRRVDYSLAINNRNEVFVEVKRPSQDLERHEKQLLEYAFHLGVEIAVLTNGLVYWFYLPMTKGAWTDRKFYTIDVLSQDPHEVASRFIDTLAKENVSSGYAAKEARRIYESHLKNTTILETLPEAWNKIVNEPDGLLVDLLSETTERLCGFKPEEGSVKQFLVDRVKQLRLTNVSLEPVPPEPAALPPATSVMTTRLMSSEDKVEIQLTLIHTPKTYSLIPVPKEVRRFFPGYKIPFTLETDIGKIETRVTSAPQGTQIGNPDAGNYIQGGLTEWYKRHGSLSDGSTLIIQVIEMGKKYKLDIKRS